MTTATQNQKDAFANLLTTDCFNNPVPLDLAPLRISEVEQLFSAGAASPSSPSLATNIGVFGNLHTTYGSLISWTCQYFVSPNKPYQQKHISNVIGTANAVNNILTIMGELPFWNNTAVFGDSHPDGGASYHQSWYDDMLGTLSFALSPVYSTIVGAQSTIDTTPEYLEYIDTINTLRHSITSLHIIDALKSTFIAYDKSTDAWGTDYVSNVLTPISETLAGFNSVDTNRITYPSIFEKIEEITKVCEMVTAANEANNQQALLSVAAVNRAIASIEVAGSSSNATYITSIQNALNVTNNVLLVYDTDTHNLNAIVGAASAAVAAINVALDVATTNSTNDPCNVEYANTVLVVTTAARHVAVFSEAINTLRQTQMSTLTSLAHALFDAIHQISQDTVTLSSGATLDTVSCVANCTITNPTSFDCITAAKQQLTDDRTAILSNAFDNVGASYQALTNAHYEYVLSLTTSNQQILDQINREQWWWHVRTEDQHFSQYSRASQIVVSGGIAVSVRGMASIPAMNNMINRTASAAIILAKDEAV